MEFARTRDRAAIEAFLRRDTPSHLYALADLDDFFWPDTAWFGAWQDGDLQALCLLLDKLSLPILYAVSSPHHEPTRRLLEFVTPELPDQVFANLGIGLERAFNEGWHWRPHGEHRKLLLDDAHMLDCADTSRVKAIAPRQRAELEAFYRDEAYRPNERGGRFFEPYMLERWPYCGIRERGRLVCVAGTHVLSDRQRVAALGNVVTRPDRRRRGLARATTAFLARQLRERVDHLGLNVHALNRAALRCYQALGFRPVCRYLEGLLVRR